MRGPDDYAPYPVPELDLMTRLPAPVLNLHGPGAGADPEFWWVMHDGKPALLWTPRPGWQAEIDEIHTRGPDPHRLAHGFTELS